MTTVETRAGAQIITRGTPEWESARQAWNLAVDQQPEAIVYAESADQVADAVQYAWANSLRVAAQGTGHGASSLGSLEGTLLIKTERMKGVEIDPETRTARVEAGVVWLEVVQAAAPYGLAGLSGSAPDVGVVGYTLGGGMSFLGRKYGLASNTIVAVELVTADGRLVRADADTEPDLYWALRGGGGSFGVVTAVELQLFPLREVYAGVLWWPIDRGREVLQTWRELTESGLPDELTTLGRYLQLPPLPEIPEPVRGKSFVVVEAIHLGDPAEADRLLAPLRALEPAMDTIRTIPITELSHLHMDPEHPVPGAGDGMLLGRLSEEAIDEIVRLAGAGAGSPLLSVEIRQLGGELGQARPGSGALASFEAEYALFAVGIAPTPEAKAASEGHVERIKDAMAPWAARHMYLNFAETRRDPSTLWSEGTYKRLRQIKAQIDPTNLFRSNHPITPANE